MAKMLWKPSDEMVKKTHLYRFMNLVNERFDRDFTEYEPLYQWSVDNIVDFWATMWEFAEIKASNSYEHVIDDPHRMPGAEWFSGARLNRRRNPNTRWMITSKTTRWRPKIGETPR
jgi:acetoacetyl-CoA synthetase